MPLTSGQTTIGTVRAMVRQRADQVVGNFITDAELNGWINASYFELYNLLASAFAENYYYTTSSSIITDGTSDTFALPTDVLKLLGVDLLLTGSQYQSLRPFNFNERNRYSLGNVGATNALYPSSLRYRVAGNTLWLAPRATANQTVKLHYVPRPAALSDTATITILTTIAAAGGIVTVNGTALTAIAGATTTIMAAALAASINSTIPTLLSATSSGNVITVTIVAPTTTITWTTDVSGGVTLGAYANVFDGIAGWEELLVVDCAIKCLAKEESDPSVFMAQKSALLKRVESESKNRDVGEPARVSDIYATGVRSPWGF